MISKPISTLTFLLAGCSAFGCVSSALPPPITSDAPLGRVIIYRNGVAYFERHATVTDEALTLQVPPGRVDDFLKSLTIVDQRSGEPIPVSYPTLEGGDVEMTVRLPQGHHDLKISYVTESPAWKPSYRVVLAGDGPARLQAWAIVDNISGEDWERVKVGVGSTSALSFRYDLHSVHMVERETLSPDTLLAMAPPTGGSPYAAGGKPVRVVGNLSDEDLKSLEHAPAPETVVAKREGGRAGTKSTKKSPPRVTSGVTMGGAGRSHAPGSPLGGLGDVTTASGRPGPAHWSTPNVPVSRSQQLVLSLTRQLQSSGQRVRVEGYAQKGDSNPRHASLARANRLREQLIGNGVPADQIDAIGTGRFNVNEAVRVVTTEEPTEADGTEETGEPKPDAPPPPDAQQVLGSAHFVADTPMDIAADHSAMISILDTEAKAERVYYYDPISARGSRKFAFNAVRITNPSPYMLDSGPFTVYEGGQFLGEGLSEPILPQNSAFVPYALDRAIVADPEITSREEIERLVTIQRGIVATESRRIRKTTLTLSNRSTKSAEVFVRHVAQPGYSLDEAKHKIEKLGGAYLLPVTVAAGESVKLIIEEWTPITTTVDIRTDGGVKALALYLKKRKLEPALAAKLRAIVDTHSKMADLEEKIEVLGEQMGVYRTRVDEINVQLVTLRKVTQAARLRRHLSDKMQEISERLQAATMQMSDLKGQLMTLRIELQDQLADLTLKKKKPPKEDEPK